MGYQKKEPSLLSKVLASRWLQFLLVFMIVAMLWQVWERYAVEREAANRRAETEATYQALLEQRAELAEEVDTINDDFGIEREIRRNFDVARAGEQIVIILDDDLDAIPRRDGPEPVDVPTSPDTNWWFPFW